MNATFPRKKKRLSKEKKKLNATIGTGGFNKFSFEENLENVHNRRRTVRIQKHQTLNSDHGDATLRSQRSRHAAILPGQDLGLNPESFRTMKKRFKNVASKLNTNLE